jgi:NADH-quinone oxidoreductase subunit D
LSSTGNALDTGGTVHGAMFDTNELVINMGPQHPSTHGVLRVVLRLDGEKVVDADVVIGYLHRGIEKLSENRNWTQIVLLTDRMDYVAAATNNVGYCETVEKLLQIEVPRRARYVRTILCELQRIASHCLWIGTHAMDIGAMTVFLYAFRERELILDLFEEFCGARLTYNSMRIGGLPQDLPPGWDKKVLQFCDIMDSKIVEYEELLTHNRIWLERTKGVGIISGEEAIALGLSGPPLRGSGIPHDIRKDEPYAAYDEMQFDVPIGTNGDTYDRYLVRLEEFRQSLRIIRQATEGVPEGPIVGKVPRLIKPAAGETYHAIESPKGELGYFIVSDGKSTNPYRFRVRPPSFCNLQGLRRLIKGHLIADVVALIGSLDVVLGEVDR